MIYVGFKKEKTGLTLQIFRSNRKPTASSHKKFLSVIGAFKTLRGAKFMVHNGYNNPHVQQVSDAEQIAKREWGSKRRTDLAESKTYS